MEPLRIPGTSLFGTSSKIETGPPLAFNPRKFGILPISRRFPQPHTPGPTAPSSFG